MAVMPLARFAKRAPVPVHAVAGRDGLAAIEDLSLHPTVSLKPTPRHAGLLLVSGAVREEDHDALRRLHDQLPHPRATMWWRTEPVAGLPGTEVPDVDPASAIQSLWQRVLGGEQPSEADVLPDEPPAPWRGRGDHGQGGEGMMGGKPYGRPMAMTDDDCRDGLALDAYTARFGPFLPMFMPGLQLELTLQGDVIQAAELRRPPVPQDGADRPLRCIARLIRVLGLAVPAERILRAAQTGRDRRADPSRILRWSGAMRAIPPGLGEIAGEDVRARLDRWCDQARGGGAPEPAADGRLTDLLPGLEWTEAVLVVNSFSPGRLMTLCQSAQPAGGGSGRR